jgi:hypothetical protein
VADKPNEHAVGWRLPRLILHLILSHFVTVVAKSLI